MTDFELQVIKWMGDVSGRLSTLETKMNGLPCLANCPRPKNGELRKWTIIALAFGAGVSGGATAVLKALGVV